jgi:hypothetical protein
MRYSAVSTLAVLLVVSGLAACGGGNSSTPAAPTPTVRSVNITTTNDMLKVKETVAFAATAAHSDGSVVAVTDWASDTPQAATVDATGKVTGVAPGSANIIAKHDGVWGVKLIRVVADFQGRWDGDYAITSCSESGNFTGFCQDFNLGLILPTTMVYTQSRDVVDGTFYLGSIAAAAHGTQSEGGALALPDMTMQTGSYKIVIGMGNFSVDSSDHMQGTFRATWTTTSFPGEGRFDGRIRVMIRNSAAASAARTRSFGAASLKDLMSAVMTR